MEKVCEKCGKGEPEVNFGFDKRYHTYSKVCTRCRYLERKDPNYKSKPSDREKAKNHWIFFS